MTEQKFVGVDYSYGDGDESVLTVMKQLEDGTIRVIDAQPVTQFTLDDVQAAVLRLQELQTNCMKRVYETFLSPMAEDKLRIALDDRFTYAERNLAYERWTYEVRRYRAGRAWRSAYQWALKRAGRI